MRLDDQAQEGIRCTNNFNLRLALEFSQVGLLAAVASGGTLDKLQEVPQVLTLSRAQVSKPDTDPERRTAPSDYAGEDDAFEPGFFGGLHPLGAIEVRGIEKLWIFGSQAGAAASVGVHAEVGEQRQFIFVPGNLVGGRHRFQGRRRFGGKSAGNGEQSKEETETRIHSLIEHVERWGSSKDCNRMAGQTNTCRFWIMSFKSNHALRNRPAGPYQANPHLA